MNAETDHELTPDQWETLKALRGPRDGRRPNSVIVGQLIALGLAVISDGPAELTPEGRTVLIRGSSRLLDVAA
ncbi:hypothetical protein SSBR45G_24430 [Bradyrhizobium sp. SSBR45G]|uniref:hypothetical protein n=1 Tax=unclassified Bradyrhizobium TaxID=2631580 RepID=UPI0023429CCD|nr:MULTISPECIES: hypothetical protein [unclassified Bradyrhizobium]GLH77535.1 hypothetical protein SSBR45G_24430 [Bradyrhizobium sp. SSBR45G]GLH84359.1 hypothetical protein SSBR45R_18190 [Bradyrhizobium sp. SSBR45R]